MIRRVAIACSPGEFSPGAHLARVESAPLGRIREFTIVISGIPEDDRDEPIALDSVTILPDPNDAGIETDLLPSCRLEKTEYWSIRVLLEATRPMSCLLLGFRRDAESCDLSRRLRFSCAIVITPEEEEKTR